MDVTTGQTTELRAREPSLSFNPSGLVPGSLSFIRGYGLALDTKTGSAPYSDQLAGVRLWIDGVAAPVLSVSPREIGFQVPWEVAGPTRSVSLQLQIPGFGTVQRSLSILPFAPLLSPIAAHDDFRAVVSEADPARAGEVIHLWAIGLGAVQGTVQTGSVAPVLPPFPTLAHPTCTAAGQSLEVLFSGLSPGMAGVYQMDVGLPSTLPFNRIFVECEIGGNRFGVLLAVVPTP